MDHPHPWQNSNPLPPHKMLLASFFSQKLSALVMKKKRQRKLWRRGKLRASVWGRIGGSTGGAGAGADASRLGAAAPAAGGKSPRL